MPHIQCTVGTSCGTTWRKDNLFPLLHVLLQQSQQGYSESLAQLGKACIRPAKRGVWNLPKCWILFLTPSTGWSALSHLPLPCSPTLPAPALPGCCRPGKKNREARTHSCTGLPTSGVITNTLYNMFATFLGQHRRLAQAPPRIALSLK